jgi:hypothetical protein
VIGRPHAITGVFSLLVASLEWKVLANIDEIVGVESLIVIHLVGTSSADGRHLRVLSFAALERP